MKNSGSDDRVSISQTALSELMPLHILFDQTGRLRSAGGTARKLLPQATTQLDDIFLLTRPRNKSSLVENLSHAACTGERVELRLRHAKQVKLRGHVTQTADESLLLNFGFGMFLHEAVSSFDLNDADFPPSSQVMEYMFLHEANRSVLRELSQFNQRLKGAHAMAQAQAHSDGLTGLQNRRGLLLVLEAALADIADAPDAEGLAIAQLDLDHFKPVNDKYGHAAGDKVLCYAAKVLQDVTRSADTVARIGGDEFVLVLRGIDNVNDLQGLGDRIIQGIEQPVEFNGEHCRVSVSIGIVLVDSYDNLQVEKVLADADAALYRSKTDGRGRATIRRSSELDG